jgi:hypothetical protein
MALAQRAGASGLVAEYVSPGGECEVYAHLKVPVLGRVHGRGRGFDR